MNYRSDATVYNSMALRRRPKHPVRAWKPMVASQAASAFTFPIPIPSAILVSRPLESAESVLEFCTFDADYVDRLRDGDFVTQDHFVSYFTALLQLKLRSKLHSPQAIEDVRQETFVRVLKALRNPGTLRQPERLGAFVNTVCNNVLFEHYRSSSRSDSLDEEGQPELPSKDPNALDVAVSKQVAVKVREILVGMPVRDRDLLKAVFLDERDRDEVCGEFGVDREISAGAALPGQEGFQGRIPETYRQPCTHGVEAPGSLKGGHGL